MAHVFGGAASSAFSKTAMALQFGAFLPWSRQLYALLFPVVAIVTQCILVAESVRADPTLSV
jgi:hypothetical protein